jgi:hypothetical protein
LRFLRLSARLDCAHAMLVMDGSLLVDDFE